MKRWLPLVIGLVGALLLVTAGGWSFGIKALWAFSFLIYVPLALRMLLGGVLLASAVLAIVPRFADKVARLTVPRLPLGGLFFLLVAGLCFWFWREQTHHGDALLKLQLLSTRTLTTDPYVWKEPLDSLSAYSLTSLGRRWQWSPATAVALLSVGAGLVYSMALLVVSRWLAQTRAQQVTYVIALSALGSSQLWFGHIENYSLVTAATFVTIVLAIGYLQQRVRLGWVGLAAGLAVSFHPQALFAMPALLLLLRHRKDWQSLVILGSSALSVLLLTVGTLWWLGVPLPGFAQGYAGDDQLFWRFSEALQPSQLRDDLNNLWLIAPLFLLWLLVGGWRMVQGALGRDPIFRYLTGVSVGLLVYHVAFQNDLPRWRDWDLFAIVAPALTLWGIYSWWLPSPAATANHHHTAPCHHMPLWPALTFATLFTLAWVGTNHHYTLLQPHSDQRGLYQTYRLLDLRELLPSATITPDTPICNEPTGCERVMATTFLMPQDGDERPVIFAHAPTEVTWNLTLPPTATFLWLSPALDPVAWGWGGDGVTFTVIIRHQQGEEQLWSRHLSPTEPADLDWQEIQLDLSPYAGQSVTLLLVTTPGMADNNAADRAGWGMPWLMQGTVDRRFMP
ncbi:MAG: hypothetical protein KF832_03800 [Caldilineaceae bacterium]|nr:hypothetical protein [Caldilineaceae bacterium]